jgi:hypothetical protein
VSAQPEGTAPPPGGSGQSFQANVAAASEQTRRRSPVMFLVVGLCFFLPFVSFSCSGQRIATLSGVGLATGQDVEVEESFMREFEELESLGTTDAPGEDAPGPAPEENDPSPWAIVALAAAVLGTVFGFVLRGRARSVASLGAALVGLAGLVGLRFDLEGDVAQAEGLVAIDLRIGYWIAAVLFAVLAIAHGAFLRAATGTGSPTAEPPGPAP